MKLLRHFHACQICKCFVALNNSKFLDLCTQKVESFGFSFKIGHPKILKEKTFNTGVKKERGSKWVCDPMQEFVENYYSFEFTGNRVESDSDHEDDFDEIDIDFEVDETNPCWL